MLEPEQRKPLPHWSPRGASRIKLRPSLWAIFRETGVRRRSPGSGLTMPLSTRTRLRESPHHALYVAPRKHCRPSPRTLAGLAVVVRGMVPRFAASLQHRKLSGVEKFSSLQQFVGGSLLLVRPPAQWCSLFAQLHPTPHPRILQQASFAGSRSRLLAAHASSRPHSPKSLHRMFCGIPPSTRAS